MSTKLGFYEILQPYVAFGLLTQNSTGKNISDLQKAQAPLVSNFPGPAGTLSKIVTGILDYLSIEELHTAINESVIVYSGTAKFGGEGRANPAPPTGQSITSQNGQELSWQDDLLAFRMTVPRKSTAIQIDTAGLSGGDLTDLQQLNNLLNQFADNGTPAISDLPGNDFRLELLIRTVKIKLPSDDFIPAKVGADGWLEPDPAFKEVVFEFPRLAFVLEQKNAAGNLDLSLKSWDSAGFDDPGDVDTARLFTLTPPTFLHSSRKVGFGLERIVADFSDNITPPEILAQFGTGDDFNGFWIPLIRIFIAPARTTGLAFSARGSDLLFDQDKGFSGELALDIMNRGGKLEVFPVFFRKNAKTPLELKRGDIERGNDGTTTVSKGNVVIPGNGELHLSIKGSISPYSVTVKLGGATLTPDTTAGVNRPVWNIPEDKNGLLEIHVSDSGDHNRWNEPIEVSHVTPPGPVPPPAKKYQVFFQESSGGDPDVHIECLNNLSNDSFALIRLSPSQTNAKLQTATGQDFPRTNDGTYKFTLTPGTEPAHLVATWPILTSPPAADIDTNQQIQLVTAFNSETSEIAIKLYFKKAYPLIPAVEPTSLVSQLASKNDSRLGLEASVPGLSQSAMDAVITQFLNDTQGDIVIFGFASFEDDRNVDEEGGFDFEKNQLLSNKRTDVLELLIKNKTSRNVGKKGYSHKADETELSEHSDARFRVAVAVAHSKVNNKTKSATVELVEVPVTPAPEPPVEHPPEAAEPERPPIFRKLGFRVRFQRNKLVLGEINGELDFRTADEETAGFIKSGDTRNNEPGSNNSLVKTDPAASKSGEQGILDFKLQMSYDTATRKLNQLLALGFDKESRDGWVSKEGSGVLANTMGSLLIFAPLLNSGIDSAVNAKGDEAVKKAIIAGAEVVIATVIGITGMVKFIKFTLYGIEISATELLPDDESGDQTKFGNVSFLFDYAVDFSVDINLLILTIKSKKDNNGKPVPTRVRYRGFGFRINGEGSPTYESVFDTSKGFDLGIAEPGALVVGGPLGPILRVDSVRVARQNPLVLETDLGINANLGVISIDTVRVRIPIDPPGPPTIIPTGISVNIPGTLAGSGFLDIRDTGFTGSLDVTLVPLKLRVQVSVGLENLEVGERRITAFFLGLGVEFPAPIPLANSGLGIYGFLGLFGMHYKRDEDTPVNANLPLALDWFYNKAKGEPHLLAVEGRRTWIAAPDRWSFGIGMVLGTMEGAFILNLKGMLVLELPGPRILIFVKAQILQPRPPSGKPADQTAGILAVVDINYQVGYIAIGLVFTYEIKDLVKIEVPIDTQFSFHDIEDWHLYIGSLRNKASAKILGIAKGTAYLMFDGKGIPDFPLGPLNGFSVAAGIAASLVIGDESSGLYAKVTGALDVGVSTAPLHFFGRMTLEGRIHLWFVGIGASAKLDVEAPEPLFVKGEVCGSIDLWLTSISGCVDITIGEPQPLPEPEPIATGLSLQSHSPALVEGQATDQPVDSSLAIAHETGDLVTGMPIDVIPVLQMKFPPVLSPAFTGLKPSSDVPTLPPGSDGWFSMGGVPGNAGERELQYILDEISISPALPGPPPEIPVTWWQPARPNVPADSQSTDKGVNLALDSWIPVPFPRAYQRSEDQIKTIHDRFEVICRQVAPAASILWTFNAHFTITTSSLIRNPGDPFPGYSPNGWKLNGIAWPDPPDTHRSRPLQLKLYVHEADYRGRNNQLMLDYAARLTGFILDPAKVIPPTGGIETGQALQLPFLQFNDGLQDGTLLPALKEMAKKFLEEAGNRERIVIETGDASLVRALICANVRRKVTEFMIVRAFNDKNEIVDELKLPGNIISGMNELPASWQDQSGPWLADVRRVFALLAGEFKGTHNLFLMEYRPDKPIARIELMYEHEDLKIFKDPPPVILGVVEILTKAEVERVVSEQHYQDTMVDVVVKSLEEGDKRPLFAPDTTYTVTMKYKGTIRLANDHSKFKSKNFTQQFRFKTAAVSPQRLNPWILAMVPENDADGFFTKDKVQFIFNDASAIQLFKAFGKTLNVRLRKANGNHPPEKPEITVPVLQAIKARIKSPYITTMLELVADMPCIPQITETESHQVFTVDIPLERQTNYMMDIESTPASEDGVTPLFRTAFTTSRYESAQEFASVVAAGIFGEKRLRSPLAIPAKTLQFVIPDNTLPDNVTSAGIEIVTDADMEAALLAAYGSDLPAPRKPGMSLLWSHENPSLKTGVLIDAPESLLRTRKVPVRVDTPTPDDDVIQHFRDDRQLYMDIMEDGSSLVEKIIYTSGGCRAILLLKPGASGTLRLALRTYRHILMVDDPLTNNVELININLPERAPWEI
jgi:large repetitive protein